MHCLLHYLLPDDDALSDPASFGRPDRRPAKLLYYGLIDMSQGATNGGAIDPPLQVDAGAGNVSLHHPLYAGPVAVVTASPTSGRAPLTVSFDASQSSGDISRYVWDYGDGASAADPKVIHTYTAVGTYVATLTVNNSAGADSDQVVITVTRKK